MIKDYDRIDVEPECTWWQTVLWLALPFVLIGLGLMSIYLL